MLVCRYIAYGRIRMDTFKYIKLNIVKPTFRADVGRSNYCVLPSMRPVFAFWHWAHVEGYIGGILDCPS